jgi:hypothetical protein
LRDPSREAKKIQGGVEDTGRGKIKGGDEVALYAIGILL